MPKKIKPNALAYDIKQAAKRQREQAHMDKLKREALKAAKAAKCGHNSSLPTDTNWDAVMSDRHTNRFFEDATCKGINHYIEKQMLGARIRKPKH